MTTSFGRAGTMLFGAEERLLALEIFLGSTALAVMTIAVAVSLMFRLLGIPIPNLGEVALVMMAAATFVGASVTTAVRSHIVIDVATLIPSSRLRRLIAMAVDALVAAFCVPFLIHAWDMFVYLFETGERTLELRIPIWISWAILLAGVGCMALHSVFGIVRELAGLPLKDDRA